MIVLPSQASTVTRVGDTKRNGFSMLLLDVTGTPNNAETLQVVVEVQDEISGKWIPTYTSAALAATAFGGATPTDRITAFIWGSGAATATWANGIGPVLITGNPPKQGIPRRVRMVQSAGGSWTYSLSAV